jgi:hypothetical protein
LCIVQRQGVGASAGATSTARWRAKSVVGCLYWNIERGTDRIFCRLKTPHRQPKE